MGKVEPSTQALDDNIAGQKAGGRRGENDTKKKLGYMMMVMTVMTTMMVMSFLQSSESWVTGCSAYYATAGYCR